MRAESSHICAPWTTRIKNGNHATNESHQYASMSCTTGAKQSRIAYHMHSCGLPPSGPLADRPNKVTTGSGANFTARYGSHCGPGLHCECVTCNACATHPSRRRHKKAHNNRKANGSYVAHGEHARFTTHVGIRTRLHGSPGHEHCVTARLETGHQSVH